MAIRERARKSSLRLLCGVALLGFALAGTSTAATNRAAGPDLRLYNGPELPAARDLTGVWQQATYDPALRPIDGKPLPFTAEGRKEFAENANKKTTEGGKNLCQPLGTPRAYVSPYPIMFVQVPSNLITIYHEENRTYRLIRLDAPHMDPGPWDPSYVGEAVAKWEGDTLVVDTTNFNALTWLDDTGVPTSERLHVIDRWKKIDKGQRLEVEFTIDDPKIFTHPWKAKRVYEARPDVQLSDDWVCGEPHRSLAGVKGIDKLYEQKGVHE